MQRRLTLELRTITGCLNEWLPRSTHPDTTKLRSIFAYLHSSERIVVSRVFLNFRTTINMSRRRLGLALFDALYSTHPRTPGCRPCTPYGREEVHIFIGVVGNVLEPLDRCGAKMGQDLLCRPMQRIVHKSPFPLEYLYLQPLYCTLGVSIRIFKRVYRQQSYTAADHRSFSWHHWVTADFGVVQLHTFAATGFRFTVHHAEDGAESSKSQIKLFLFFLTRRPRRSSMAALLANIETPPFLPVSYFAPHHEWLLYLAAAASASRPHRGQ